MTAKPKPKSCHVCRAKYTPFLTTQKACSPTCALELSRRTQEREYKRAKAKYRRETKRRREAIKTRSQWLREAQQAFNRYIRARDYGKPCISSGRAMDWNKPGGAVDAGHYRSTGAASHLRFNVFNCHAQSVKDNRDLSGNVVDYRINLIERIGLERVDRLENDNAPRKFDIAYLKRVKALFNRRAKHYERRRGL